MPQGCGRTEGTFSRQEHWPREMTRGLSLKNEWQLAGGEKECQAEGPTCKKALRYVTTWNVLGM